jgi:predicted Rossmann-fold nucleotide-binding protein
MQAETGEMTKRLRVVGGMGSGSHEHAEVAEPLGRWHAGEGVHLLTGGGGGVMTAVARAFAAVEGRAGLVVGVLPCGDEAAQPRPGYPNPFVERVIQTHLPLSGHSGTRPCRAITSTC